MTRRILYYYLRKSFLDHCRSFTREDLNDEQFMKLVYPHMNEQEILFCVRKTINEYKKLLDVNT